MFNLHDLAVGVIEASEVAGPTAIAKQVADQIPNEHLRVAVEQALPRFVMGIVSNHRVRPSLTESTAESTAESSRADGTSRYVSRLASTWQKMLREQVAVAPGEWKFMRDCGISDLEYAAAVREELGRQNFASAAWHRDMIEQLKLHNVGTVGELPEPEGDPS